MGAQGKVQLSLTMGPWALSSVDGQEVSAMFCGPSPDPLTDEYNNGFPEVAY